MKIITLSTKDSFGGAARVAYRLCEEIIKRGYDDILLVNSKRTDSSFVHLASEFHDTQTKYTYRTEKLKYKIKEYKREFLWKKYPNRLDKVYSDVYISYLKNALSKLEFDLIHMHWIGDSFVNFTELPTNKPIIWTLHDCFAFTGVCSYFEDCDKFQTHCSRCPQLQSLKDKDISYDVFELKMKRYTHLHFHIVTPSNWLAKAVSESKLLSNYPITVIPNGVNTQVFYPLDKRKIREQLSIDIDKKVILFGGISAIADPRKGSDLLMDSLSLFYESHKDQKEDYLLLIFGSEEQNDYLFGFETHYVGYIQDEKKLNEFYNVADVMIVPSRHENLPNTILESLSAGTPVIAFDIGGNSDMIEHQSNGYLAKPFDIIDMKNGIEFCLNQNTNNHLNRCAREIVMKKFTIENIANQYIELYKKVLI